MRKFIKLKIILNFIVLGLLSKTYAQDNYKLHLKEYHSSQITDIITSKNEERILTIDASGKILKYNTDDFSYHSTLKNSDGFFIESPRLIFDGKGLLYKSKDTLWILNSEGKVSGKSLFKGNIISNKNSPFTILTNSIKNTMDTEIGIFNDKFQPFTSFKANNEIKVASINKDSTNIAYVEEHYTGKQNLVLRDLNTKKVLWENEVNDNYKIIYPFFNEETKTLYTVTLSKEKKMLAIFGYKNSLKSPKPTLEIPWSNIDLSTIITDYFSKSKQLIITKKNALLYDFPIIITYKKGRFIREEISLSKVCNSPVLLESKNQLVIPNQYFSNGYNDIANFSVQDLTKNSNKIIPDFSREFYKGMFLPDDSFLVEGLETKEKNFKTNELQIKYFSKGTFYNRFNNLPFIDYLEVNHKVSFYSNDYLFNEDSGSVIFRGSSLVNNESYIFKYNFIEDTVIKLYKIKDKYFSIIDYDASSNKLLLSPKKYYNRGYTDPQPLAIIENNKLKEFIGLYKFAKFSNKAKHILTINDKNVAEIRTDLETVTFEKKLIDGSYILHNADNGFVVSNVFQTFDFGKCNKESVFFIPDENGLFTSEKKDCIYVNDLSYVDEKVALAIENLGIILVDKIIPETAQKKIKSVSFNNDASKLMISYANGKISIVDSETLKEIGGMFHPSEKEHIFYDSDNHYFSNTNADDFLYVTKNDKKESLQNADKTIFKPQEVLNVFSTPNQEYLTLLEKAISLRKNKKEFSEIKTLNKLTNTPIVDKKGDLYLLSIGVSKYKQEAFNLTFADKDAFDIANVYGKLDSITIKDFRDEFLGTKYSLKSTKNENLGSINSYSGDYSSIGEMFPIDFDGKIWLEINYEKTFIWNYNTNSIDEINFPNDYKKESFSFKKQIYTSKTGNEFYIRTNENTFYKYEFSSKKFIKIKMPFTIDFEQEADNLQPLLNNKWFHFNSVSDGLKNEIKVSIGDVSSKEITIKSFDINRYKEFGKEEVLEGSIYNPQFKDVNKSGTFLLYRAGDDETFVINLEKETTPIKVPINIAYGDEASIAEDGTKITILNSKLNEFRHKTITYNLKGEVIEGKTFVDEDYNIKGVSIFNAAPKWIKASSSLVDSFNYSAFSSDEILSKSTPFSFNKTFVKKITNSEATKENIEVQIADFLKNTKEEDQVILFIAGHGVLDKDNNYYYAPYNMDFNDVTKNGVAFNTIINGLSNSKASQKLLLMDTCHAGNTLDIDENSENKTIVSEAGKRGTVTTSNKKAPKFKVSDIVSTLFDDFLSKSGITILSASSGADVAYENKELSNGAFTSAYLKILKSKMSNYSINKEDVKKTIPLTEDFIAEVLKEVMLLTNGKQVPDIREINKNVIIKAW
ncbi:caspase family protein [Polaribacter sp. Hel_I_88]|uniref:caspase family protein n=1 Tax=Polaribacter sp. Hel_I_88 TaxID=1250006 RepID=UPI000B001F4E|nr:caspase family protein [Polaribacter sp. Hel_I_88]